MTKKETLQKQLEQAQKTFETKYEAVQKKVQSYKNRIEKFFKEKVSPLIDRVEVGTERCSIYPVNARYDISFYFEPEKSWMDEKKHNTFNFSLSSSSVKEYEIDFCTDVTKIKIGADIITNLLQDAVYGSIFQNLDQEIC